MLKDEMAMQIKEERPTEDAHTETDDDTPMEVMYTSICKKTENRVWGN